MDSRGQTVRKTFVPEHLSLGEALNDAIADIDENWPRYLQDVQLRSRP